MKAISTETLHFPSLNWGITAGEERELPADKDAAAEILKHPAISEVGAVKHAQQEKSVNKK